MDKLGVFHANKIIYLSLKIVFALDVLGDDAWIS